MSKYGSVAVWLKSLHATSSLFGPWSMRANYSTGKAVKDKVLSTSPDVFGDVFKLQMMYPLAKVLGRSKSFRPLVTVRAHRGSVLRKCKLI